MPRNASGTYSLPSGNPVSSGTLIDATWANNTLNDIANEMTDSLSRSGEGGMLAPFRLNDGVQATPGLAFTNEPSTGMYRAGTNEAWLVAGGTQVLQFTTNGAAARFAAGAVGTPSITALGDLNTGLWFPAADTLAASTGGSERLRVDSSGNVGIGTASPAQRLHVNGDIQQENANYLRGKLAAGTVTRIFGLNAANSLYVGGIDAAQSETLFVRGGTEQMRLDASGNLGIGTASPSAYGKFVVVGTGDICNLDTTSGATGIAFFENGVGRARIRTLNGSDGLAFLSGATERMRIDANGNIGIGTASPISGAGLTIGNDGNGSALVRSVFSTSATERASVQLNGATGEMRLTAGYAGYGGLLTIHANGSERMRVTSDGNIVAGASAALATNATNGFLYVPTCAGVPTGTPTAVTGMVPIVVDTTNNRWYFYSGGAWRNAGP